MDDLRQFLDHQQALADMSDGDMDEYEARMHLRAKRRKLWKSVETFASTSQTNREDSDFLTYLNSLESYEGGSHETSADANSRQNSDSHQGVRLNESHASTLSATSSEPIKYYPDTRDLSVKHDEAFDAFGHKTLGNAILSSGVQTLASSSPVLVSASYDTPFTENEISGDRSAELGRISKNERMGLRERALRKRKVTGTNDGNASLDSNITSPSSTPRASTRTSQAAATLREIRALPSESDRQAKKVIKSQKEAQAAARKKEEEEEKKMTPREYAIHVHSKFTAYLEKTAREKLTLKDKAIFYIGGDYHTASQSTRKKMDHLRKRGATVVPSYDPNIVTHIVTEGNATITLKALGLNSLDEIPMHIPTLTWSWITESKPSSQEFWFAAFPSRIDATSDKAPNNLKTRRIGIPTPFPRSVQPTDDDYSRIEDFTVLEHSAPMQIAQSTSKVQLPFGSSETAKNEDPLAEFYAQAVRDREAEIQPLKLSSRDPDVDSPTPGNGQKSKFTCDEQNPNTSNCVNQDIIDKLTELEHINKTKVAGDPDEQRWRVFSYGKSIRAIRAHPKRIRNYEDAISIRGIGQKTAQKIVEIIKTGDLGRIKFDNTEDVQAIRLFYNIYGVGISTAQKWYMNGCKTLHDIRARKGGIKLSDVQEIGLKYYDDINTRIPRGEVSEIFETIKSIALSIDPKLFFQVMGSYRRGKETCGDIDILMTRPTYDGRTHRGVLRTLLKELHLRGILTEDLALPEDFKNLEQTYRGLCRRDEKSLRRRIDILAVPYHERGGALIYYTGDDIFNRAIRYKAKKMGYSLSQHGLSTSVLRDERGKKLVPGDLIASETEEEIFRILGVPWQEPHERVRAPA